MRQMNFWVQNNRCSISAEMGMLVLASPYIPALVEAIKSLPHTERRYDANRKVWLIDPRHGANLLRWVELYAGETVNLPSVSASRSDPIMQLLEVRYVGACKQREDGTSTAFGLVGRDWSLIFPEAVLRAWFDAPPPTEQVPNELQTLYQVLGIKKAATDDEIRIAFRRMTKQWHPDVCKEPNATEIFIRIREAYEVLADGNKRARYDAGLVLQKAFEKAQKQAKKNAEFLTQVSANYRSPLRCGMLLVEGIEKIGRLEATKILAWQDIVRNGKTLVSSWPAGAKEPLEVWA